MQSNPYQRYAEANLLSSNPLELVVALYKGAREGVLAACRFNEAQDHAGRGRSVNKALDILMELTCSLDVSAGGTVAVQLRDLYAYMGEKLVQAHAEESQSKLTEVAGLLGTLLEGWQQIAVNGAGDAGYGVDPVVAANGGTGSFEYARL